MGPIRAIASFGLAAALAAPSGCALSHEQPRDLTTAASPHRVCDHGAITYCAECERPICCLHFCQEDGTWSACGYVENACPDAGTVGAGDSSADAGR